MPIQIPTWAWTLQAPGKVHWAETPPTCPIPQVDIELHSFPVCFLKFKSTSWIHLLWNPPTYSAHCSIHLVSRCCPVIQGWLGNQGFQDRSCGEARDGTPYCTLCGLWYPRGDYTSCSRITPPFPEACRVCWSASWQTYAGKQLLLFAGFALTESWGWADR